MARGLRRRRGPGAEGQPWAGRGAWGSGGAGARAAGGARGRGALGLAAGAVAEQRGPRRSPGAGGHPRTTAEGEASRVLGPGRALWAPGPGGRGNGEKTRVSVREPQLVPTADLPTPPSPPPQPGRDRHRTCPGLGWDRGTSGRGARALPGRSPSAPRLSPHGHRVRAAPRPRRVWGVRCRLRARLSSPPPLPPPVRLDPTPVAPSSSP